MIDHGIQFSRDDIKFTGKDDMIARWEKELAETKSAEVAQTAWERTSFNPEVAPIACICIGIILGMVIRMQCLKYQICGTRPKC